MKIVRYTDHNLAKMPLKDCFLDRTKPKLWQNRGKNLNDVSSQPGLKKHWTLTDHAFGHLLRWLDAGENSHGNSYLLMRSRLVKYFDRKQCLNPDDLADEVLTRHAERFV